MGTYDDEDSQEDHTYGNFRVTGNGKGDARDEPMDGYDEKPRAPQRRRRIQTSAAGGAGGGGSRAMGLLIWVGVIILFNVLSYTFNWGWILY